MKHIELTKDTLCKIYDILVTECNVDESMKESFVFHHLKKDYPNEWRICGKLGYGGKIWRREINFANRVEMYISCYGEDETEERLKLISKVNKRIAKLLGTI